MPTATSVRRLVVCAFLVVPAPALAQAPVQGETSQIRDVAGMFDLEAIRKARAELDRIERERHVPVLIETVESVEGERIDEVSLRRAKNWGAKGIYVLISRRDHKIRVRDYQSFLGSAARVKIQEAFAREFAKNNYDEGLLAGITAIRQAVEKSPEPALTAEAPPLRAEAAPFEPPTDGEPLVLRNQIRLTLPGARQILAGSEAKAAAMKLKVNVAVVDDGGHLITFARMDGARPASATTALTKAISAATFRQPSGPLPAGVNPPDLLLNLSLQNAAAANGGKISSLYGGVPIVVDGQIIGGVGVGGGTGEQDAEVARAGISVLLSHLKASETRRPAAEAEPKEGEFGAP
jgi:glc operon protein GlcG